MKISKEAFTSRDFNNEDTLLVFGVHVDLALIYVCTVADMYLFIFIESLIQLKFHLHFLTSV